MKWLYPKNAVLSFTIKVIILLLLVWALYAQLVAQDRFSVILKEWQKGLHPFAPLGVLLAGSFMFANWGLEALKWQRLIQILVPIRFVRAFKAVWTGVTLGLFTPNRIGEYGGRLLYIPPAWRFKGVVSSLIGSYAQILATLLTGMITLLFFLYNQLNVQQLSLILLVALVILLAVVLLLAYFNLSVVALWFQHRSVFKRIAPYLYVLTEYSFRTYGNILILSLIRYLVFSAQYLILLTVFGVHLPIGEGFTAVGVIFLAQTVLPSFAVAELLTRGNISLYVLGNYTENSGAILAASTALWLLNLIIPAILGYVFILRKNFFKTK